MDLCRLCEAKKPKRFCPAAHGEICSPCCGEQREVTLDCPLDCEYLIEARLHNKLPEVNPDQFPNLDIRVTELFLRENEQTLLLIARSLLEAALATPGASDNDVRESLQAVIKTHRTLETGLIYQTRPANPYAGAIQERLEGAIAHHRQQTLQATGMHSIRDSQLLGLFVFLQRLEIQHNNGRRRGRAFLSFLLDHFHAPAGPPPAQVISLS
ncbi:MAG: hypothetical protein JJE04_26995 [Acidobacteriia bacterium]|nr:hypothetical protein [Terriglobia bacterium]